MSSWKRHISYGWVIVIVAAMAMVATLPGRTHGLGMITERLLKDPAFSMSRVEYSDINLWATLLGGLFCLPCGWLIDRVGLRSVLTIVVGLLGAVVLWMTQLSGNTALLVAITLTRGFGQSALSVLSITMVGKWFRKGVSLPMAVYSVVLSLGFAGAAQWAKPYGDAEWRTVWGAMGWLLLGVMLPVALLLTREPSAEDGNGSTFNRDPLGSALPSDDPNPSAPQRVAVKRSTVDSPHEIGFTLVAAMRTPAFWMFGLAISHMAVISSGLSLFNQSVLQSQGFPTQAYYDLITLSGIAGLIAQLPIGWLGRHVSLARMQTVGLVLQAACMLWLPHVRAQTQLTIYGVCMGVGGAISTVLFFSIWGHAFGQRQLGRIQGFAQMLTVLASALGPKLLAECQARTGNYQAAFQALAVVGFVLAIGSWIVRVPKPEDADAEYVRAVRNEVV